MKRIDELLEDGGDVSIGAIENHPCVAAASDGHNTVAMVVRRDGEALSALLRRLDRAIAKFLDDGEIVDEVYGD